MLIMLMMMLQNASHAGSPYPSLDADLLEFLSLYEKDDEDLLDLVIEEESARPEDSPKASKVSKVSKAKEESSK